MTNAEAASIRRKENWLLKKQRGALSERVSREEAHARIEAAEKECARHKKFAEEMAGDYARRYRKKRKRDA